MTDLHTVTDLHTAARISAGGFTTQLTSPAPARSTPRPAGAGRVVPQEPQHHLAPEQPGRAWVWKSPRSGAVLARGRVMTQAQAIHVCLTHTRNEVIAEQTTSTRIVYRAPAGPSGVAEVIVYEAVTADTAQPPHPGVRPALRPVAAGQLDGPREADLVASASPTVIVATDVVGPRAAGLRFRVVHRSLEDADHAYQREDDEPFVAQTASLVEALQVERLLDAYDAFFGRHSERDIEVWDGIAWSPSSDTDPAFWAADVFLGRLDAAADYQGDAGTQVLR